MSRTKVAVSAVGGIIACLVTGAAEAQMKAEGQGGVEALAAFLVRAKTQGYASGDERRVGALGDGGREVAFKEGEYAYRDRWYGEQRFSGQEIVWRLGTAVWSMNFFGATSSDEPIPPSFTKFHKSALRLVSVESPFRGPALYREGDLVYVNDCSGSIREFAGVERIFWRDKEIYRLVYHGGQLQP